MKHTRSPINLIPLRSPGDGLLQKRTLILFEEIIIWIFAVGMIGIFTALEWLR